MPRDPRSRDLAVIHQLRKLAIDAGLIDEDTYRDIVGGILDARGITGTASSAHLDEGGRAELILTFGTLGVRLPNQRPRPLPSGHGIRTAGTWRGRYLGAGRKGFAGVLTQAQADRIAGLEETLGWLSEPLRLRAFIERQIGRPADVATLRVSEATTLITGLQRLADGQAAPVKPRRATRGGTTRTTKKPDA